MHERDRKGENECMCACVCVCVCVCVMERERVICVCERWREREMLLREGNATEYYAIQIVTILQCTSQHQMQSTTKINVILKSERWQDD